MVIISALLLTRLMGHYCFACCRLSVRSVGIPGVFCNVRGWSTADTAWQDTVRLRPVRATPCSIVNSAVVILSELVVFTKILCSVWHISSAIATAVM